MSVLNLVGAFKRMTMALNLRSIPQGVSFLFKGGLTSEDFSLLLKYPKKCCKNYYEYFLFRWISVYFLAHFLAKMKTFWDYAIFIGEFFFMQLHFHEILIKYSNNMGEQKFKSYWWKTKYVCMKVSTKRKLLHYT